MRATTQACVILGAFFTVTGCSADSPDSADASSVVTSDARDPIVFADSAPPIFPDAMADTPDAAPACPDTNEPNNTQGTATALAAIDDCDSNGDTLTGAIITGDEDWFTFDVTDASLCSVDPTVAITGSAQVCMFFTCTTGTPDATCPEGTTAPGGGPVGCCGTNDFTVSFNCVGPVSDDGNITLQITSTVADSCEDYSIDYHY